MNPTSSKPEFVPNSAAFQLTCPHPGPRGLVVVLLLFSSVWWVAPWIAKRQHVDRFASDYRTAEEHSEDYWLAARHADQSFSKSSAIVLGDSVVWGEFVNPSGTLTSHLNRLQQVRAFSNGGTNGLHPLAIEGLVSSYLKPRGERVVLHVNPLWYTSGERDLSDPDGLSFNHPRLIPQFSVKVPAYRASIEDRLSVSIERTFELRQWARHLWIQRLGGHDLPRWSLEHPQQFLPAAPEPVEPHQVDDRPWTEKGIRKQTYDWISLEDSQQWAAMQRTISCLRANDNQVYVLVGPFNSHLLTDSSTRRLTEIRDKIASQLVEQSVPHWIVPVLPTEQYADASHPLDEGYETWATQLWSNDAFREWCK